MCIPRRGGKDDENKRGAERKWKYERKMCAVFKLYQVRSREMEENILIDFILHDYAVGRNLSLFW